MTVDVRLTTHGPLNYPNEFDVALITRPRDRMLPDSSYRRYLGKLGSGRSRLEYLKKRGTPRDLSELRQHDCLSYLSTSWRFRNAEGGDRVLEINPILRSGSNESFVPPPEPAEA